MVSKCRRKPEPLYELCWIWDGCLCPPRPSPGRLSVAGHQPKVTLQISPKAPPVSSWTEWQILVPLLVWCPSTVLPSSQHIMVGLLRRLHTSENTCLRPHIHICAVLMEMVLWTLTEFQVQPCLTSSDKDKHNKRYVLPLILLWPCWDFHLHQSCFRA